MSIERWVSALKYVGFLCGICYLGSGLLYLTAGKSEIVNWTQATHISASTMWWPFPIDRDPVGDGSRFTAASVRFFLGALVLCIPLACDTYLMNRRVRALGTRVSHLRLEFGPSIEFDQSALANPRAMLLVGLEMNWRLWILQCFLATSIVLMWVRLQPLVDLVGSILRLEHYDREAAEFWVKLPLRLLVSFAVVWLLKYLRLVPEWCRVWSGFDPRVWYKTFFKKYSGLIVTASLSAVIGIDLLGIAYAMLNFAWFSDVVFPIGALFLMQFAWGGWRANGQLILLGWVLINLAYFLDGLVNFGITYYHLLT